VNHLDVPFRLPLASYLEAKTSKEERGGSGKEAVSIDTSSFSS